MPANPTSAQGQLITMLVLGIESSCDDTGVALYDGAHGLLGHLLHSQTALQNHHCQSEAKDQQQRALEELNVGC